jgi:hypothetical protein
MVFGHPLTHSGHQFIIDVFTPIYLVLHPFVYVEHLLEREILDVHVFACMVIPGDAISMYLRVFATDLPHLALFFKDQRVGHGIFPIVVVFGVFVSLSRAYALTLAPLVILLESITVYEIVQRFTHMLPVRENPLRTWHLRLTVEKVVFESYSGSGVVVGMACSVDPGVNP